MNGLKFNLRVKETRHQKETQKVGLHRDASEMILQAYASSF